MDILSVQMVLQAFDIIRGAMDSIIVAISSQMSGDAALFSGCLYFRKLVYAQFGLLARESLQVDQIQNFLVSFTPIVENHLRRDDFWVLSHHYFSRKSDSGNPQCTLFIDSIKMM
ncbi:hypothetical protein FGO68_gene2547 [Halteria grandinella]|uniref:Uncharacterized protein n=1 Tax=Halteria grandinella TaxID=5974 RepID=A0A8J8NEL7_HALGN|nr:hypothetical protein FGO68_gene2547 [Halteria grandinella]